MVRRLYRLFSAYRICSQWTSRDVGTMLRAEPRRSRDDQALKMAIARSRSENFID